jgi:hypothetical protein
VEPLMAVLRDEHEHHHVREAAAQALTSLGWQPENDTQRALHAIVRRAWEEVVRLGAAAVEPLVAALWDMTIQQAAAQALIQIGTVAVEPLVAMLRNRDSVVQQTAAQALGQIGDTCAVEPLVAALSDEASSVREAAAQALISLGWQPGNDAQRTLLAIAQGKGLTLPELVNPIFPYVAPNDRVNEISVDSPLHSAVTARGAFLGKRCQTTEYLRILQDATTTCPHEDLPYVWLAELHLIQGRYAEAKRWAFAGINKAHEFERLTYVLASVYLRMMDPAAIGWFIQSCLLATFEFIPYLFCARCAEVAALNGLSRRLLNASDAIRPGGRVPNDEAQVVSLALKVDRTELVNAMSTFQANMESCLPAADAFPEHSDERDIFIWAHDDIRSNILRKLFARPQRGK